MVASNVIKPHANSVSCFDDIVEVGMSCRRVERATILDRLDVETPNDTTFISVQIFN